MSRKLAINDDGQVVRDVAKILTAKDGTVRGVTRALVACGGVARQYWPAVDNPNTNDPRITLTTDQLDTINVQAAPTNAVASIQLNNDGTILYDDYPPNDNIPDPDGWINPPVNAPNTYVVKIEQHSGDGLQGSPVGVWDTTTVGETYIWVLERIGEGFEHATATLSVAPDAGGGLPDVANQVDKPITFRAEVTGIPATPGDILWTTQPWALEEIKSAENADCRLEFQIDGDAYGWADTSGDHYERWGANPNGTETVQVDVISGTSPTGAALGVPLSITTEREWILLADDNNEDLNCELDVTVIGNQTVVKRITMHSQRIDEANDLIWPDGETNAAIVDIGIETDTMVTVRVKANGIVEGEGLNTGINVPWPIDWSSNAPSELNASNYEVRLDFTGNGPNTQGSQQTGVWFPIFGDYEWQMGIAFDPVLAPQFLQGDWVLGFRLAGQPSTEAFLNIPAQCNTEGVGGAEIPATRAIEVEYSP